MAQIALYILLKTRVKLKIYFNLVLYGFIAFKIKSFT